MILFKNLHIKSTLLPQFFFVDTNSPCKDFLFLHGPNLVQKRLYLGTILNNSEETPVL